VEDFHDCEYQDAAEGYLDDDLDLGEEVPHRPLTPGANPLVSKLLYVHVCCNVVLFWTFSRVFLRGRFASQAALTASAEECGIELAARLTQQGLRPPDWAPAEVLAVGSTTSLASLGLAAVTTLMIGRVRISYF
jgi:hypothetical protein